MAIAKDVVPLREGRGGGRYGLSLGRQAKAGRQKPGGAQVGPVRGPLRGRRNAGDREPSRSLWTALKRSPGETQGAHDGWKTGNRDLPPGANLPLKFPLP